MRLAGIVLVAAACSGSSGERAVEPAPEVEADPMAAWKALKIRGRDYEPKLASLPEEQRRDMAIAFLRDGNFTCRALEMNGRCGEIEVRLVPVVAGDDLGDGCLRRAVALWALDQIDGETLRARLPDVARELVKLRRPEAELPRRVIEKVDDASLLVELIGLANQAGHHELADGTVARVDDDQLPELAFKYGVDAAFEAVIQSGRLDEKRAKLGRKRNRDLRRETRLRLIAYWADRAADEDDAADDAAHQIDLLVSDCPTAIAAMDAIGSDGIRLDPPDRICVALMRGGAESAELRSVVSPDGLDVQQHKDDPLDDRKDVVWNTHLPNDAAFRMPFADELVKALPDCDSSECSVPGTTVRFRLGFAGRELESIERYERLGGC